MTGKIVHLMGNLGRGGSEKQLYLLSTSLRKRGWRQAVISFAPGGVWRGPLEAAGIPVFTIDRHPLKFVRLWRLWRLMRREQPDILVAWQHHLSVYAHWLRGIGRVSKICCVRFDWTTDLADGKPIRSLGLARGALENADCVISNSRRNLDALVAQRVHMASQEVIYNIIPPGKAASPAEPAARPRIAAVGQLKPGKAWEVLLLALGRLKAEGLDFELLLAGEGVERCKLEELTRREGLVDHVRFLGDVDDVPGLLATAHLLAHSSRSEGLSNSILEGMAAGLPVVACITGATPEIIEDGRTGLLVPVDDAESLARALRRLLTDPALRGRLGAAAREHMEVSFGEGRICDRYESVFCRLLGGCDESACSGSPAESEVRVLERR